MKTDGVKRSEGMDKIILEMNMLEDDGPKLLFAGLTTDKIIGFYGWGDSEKLLNFVVCKGEIDDWCVYVEGMDREMDHDQVTKFGNKLSLETAKKLVECNDEVLGRYRT